MGPRVVIDTNVFISALGWGGKPEACVEQVLQEQADGYISPAMIDDLQRVMDYPRFGFTDAEKQSFQEIILASFHVIEPAVDVTVVEDDPDDDMVLECGVASDADYIISGDGHLQDLESFRGIDICNPAVFLDSHG
jgi:putative PIN family toxin of toxin-antitoxin system